MQSDQQQFGSRGEDLAAAYLTAKGFTVAERNVRFPWGELDLVCRKGREVVFVEVKARAGTAYGHPEEAVTRAKQRHLVRSAQAYMANHPELRAAPYRIDVIAITYRDGRDPAIVHIRNAVGTEW